MRVIYVFDAMPETYQSYVWNTLNGLGKKIALQTLCYHSHSKSDFVVEHHGFNRKWHRLKWKLGIEKHPRLDLKLMSNSEILHLQHSYLFNKLDWFHQIEKQVRPKIVITLRGGDTYIKPWFLEKWRTFYKKSPEWIDAFVVMSQNQKEYLQKWGVPKDLIHIIPISYGESISAKGKAPNKDTLKLVSVFRMCWEKNISGHLEFAKRLKEKNIPFEYDFYGDGPDMGQLYYLIDQLGLQDEVFVKGRIENDELRDKLPNYDFNVQLSLSESLGMSVIESQLFGLPAIVSRIGGLTEIVLDQESGWIMDDKNEEKIIETMIETWRMPSSYTKMSNNAMNNVKERYCTSREIEQLMKLYSQLFTSNED